MANETKQSVILIMPISSIVASSKTIEGIEKRAEQVVHGLEKLFTDLDFWNEFRSTFDLTIILSDNTTKSIPSKIVETSGDINIIGFVNNKYGCKNKGAGVIEHWLYHKDTIAKHNWIIHFEPRQQLIDLRFFKQFMNQPGQYFRYGADKVPDNQFYTGLFSCRSKYLLNFCEKYTPQLLCKHSISIEYVIYSEMIKYSDTEIINSLGLIWLDTYAHKEKIR